MNQPLATWLFNTEDFFEAALTEHDLRFLTGVMPLDELLRESQIISLHTPLTAETFHLLDRKLFAQYRREPIIINTARGAVIDTDALIEALDEGVIDGAGLDVLEKESVMRKHADLIVTEQIIARLHNPASQEEAGRRTSEAIKQIERLFRNGRLLSRPNVVFTPHVALNSVEAIERMRTMMVENINAFFAGKRLTSSPPLDDLDTARFSLSSPSKPHIIRFALCCHRRVSGLIAFKDGAVDGTKILVTLHTSTDGISPLLLIARI